VQGWPLNEAGKTLNFAAANGRLCALPKLPNQATIDLLKHAVFANYRVVYFATHGLVAGDVKGLGVPSLALTLPAEPSEVDGGLLTASEVAQLKLNADWVVLSGCKTAAGHKPGAEALSGLARSFFYADARAPVRSWCHIGRSPQTRRRDSLRRTFDIMKSATTVGRVRRFAASCWPT
jgi:hypothetical protein